MLDAVSILLVDDSENDVILVRHAFAKGHLDNPIQVVNRGDEAISYLRGDGKYSDRDKYPIPALVLLDLKMPGLSGFEVLKWIRDHRELGNLRVIVLTSSDQIRDVNQAYSLGANSYLVKPLDFEPFAQTCELIKKYWLKTDVAPSLMEKPNPNGAPGD